ncbi:MAG: formate--tetrahydrofolate ligase [Acidobacteriota bacterium]
MRGSSVSETPRPIQDVAAELGIAPEHLIPYGAKKAKIAPQAREGRELAGRLILVSAITPTSAGEGKTTTAICLAQGLAHLGEKAAIALREPSLGPTFGLKGGATGAGRASLIPGQEINLHFTGDFHAISSANNLLAAAIDNHLHHGNALGIDPRRILWRRVIDLNDRALRQTIVGLGGPTQGMPRETGFDITPASEVMASLCLAESEDDLRDRLARLIVAQSFEKKPVTAADLKAVGSMMVLLKEAMNPNLVQTIEGVPAFVHGGPFANIAHGCNSVAATKMALGCADWVVTEAGFGADLGAEKFFDIKCRSAGLDPAAVVLVTTVRALKRHGGVAQKKLDEADPAAVQAGLPNLEKHLENLRQFGRDPVVAINRFPSDTADEIAVIRRACERLSAACAESTGVVDGGAGAADLARAVIERAEQAREPHVPLYSLEDPVQEKLHAVATRMYGAREVLYAPAAKRDLKLIEDMGYGHLPICVAKTPMSLSSDPKRVGRPEGFDVTVSRVVLSAGAGFLVPMVGDILRMPGLSKSPQMERIDLVDGRIEGLR